MKRYLPRLFRRPWPYGARSCAWWGCPSAPQVGSDFCPFHGREVPRVWR